jgi:thiol-disulfide isomerase/thioredoxin
VITRTRLAVAAALVAAFAAGLWLQLHRPAPTTDALFALSGTDLNGQQRSLSEWRGQPLVVNFWATWCAPCREEIPLFVRAARDYQSKGVRVIGVALDRPDAVRQFVQQMAIDYPIVLGAGPTLDVIRQLGNRDGGLPFTLFIDAQGVARTQKLGALSDEELRGSIDRLLPSARAPATKP